MIRYAVFSYVKDRRSNEAVPVGVVAWSAESGWHKVQFTRASEPPDGLQAEDYLPYLALVQDKLAHWEETGQLPYAEGPMRPCEDRWWLHVRKLLNHEIRLSEPRDLLSGVPCDAVESLFLTAGNGQTLPVPVPSPPR
jgi:hypothetical protein